MNGPSHYVYGSWGSTARMLGDGLFKKRILEVQGYKVLYVPYFDWKELKGAKSKKFYLQNLLGLPKEM